MVDGEGVGCLLMNSYVGRAIGVGASETYDMRDDAEGMDGGMVMKEFWSGEMEGCEDMMLELAGCKNAAGYEKKATVFERALLECEGSRAASLL